MNDIKLMHLAISLAKKGAATTTPNPRVGCVIVDSLGNIVGQGYHQFAGHAHAEIHALNDAGISAKGATAYVTLEPCCHFGKTPPCTEALIQAGIRRVVIGSTDKNPLVKDGGILQLKQAGISVETGVLEKECDDLNKGFFKRMQKGLPYVTIKMAMSLDGRIATRQRKSKWITNDLARKDVQQLRKNTCALLTSSKTVLDDDPQLNVRLKNVSRQPIRVIADTNLSISRQAKLFEADGEVWIFHASEDRDKMNSFSDRARLFYTHKKGTHLNLKSLMQTLAKNEINEVLVESGGHFAGALVEQKLVDSLVIYQAPILLGHEGIAAFNLSDIDNLSDTYGFQVQEYSKIGDNFKIVMATVL